MYHYSMHFCLKPPSIPLKFPSSKTVAPETVAPQWLRDRLQYSKTTSTDGDTAVFYIDSSAFFLEICNDAYVVNDTAENSGYTNCGVLSTGYGDKKVFVYESRIAAQLLIKMTGNGTGYIIGAALCSTSKS